MNLHNNSVKVGGNKICSTSYPLDIVHQNKYAITLTELYHGRKICTYLGFSVVGQNNIIWRALNIGLISQSIVINVLDDRGMGGYTCTGTYVRKIMNFRQLTRTESPDSIKYVSACQISISNVQKTRSLANYRRNGHFCHC